MVADLETKLPGVAFDQGAGWPTARPGSIHPSVADPRCEPLLSAPKVLAAYLSELAQPQ
jgi:hypothetical protein